MGGSPFTPPFGAPAMGRSGNVTPPNPFGANPMMGTNPMNPMAGPNPMMGANPYGMPTPGMGNNGAPNVDELVKKIDAQIAKLEEEERQEKEKLAKMKENGKVPETNEFEKLINKKYEDYKLGEEQKNNPPVKEENPVQVSQPPIFPQVPDMFGMNNSPVAPQPFNPGMPGSSVSVDDLIKKIDAKIAELEKEEEEEKRKEAEKSNNSNKSQENNKVDDLQDKGEFPNPFKVEEMNPFINTTVKDVPVKEVKEEVAPNLVDLMKTENVKAPVENIKDIEVQKQEIEKPNINIDVDSIVTNDNVTDDEFFDDFFGDDDF